MPADPRRRFARNAAAHTSLFATLRRAMRLAAAANQPGTPPVDELLEMGSAQRTTRRNLLQAGVVGATALTSGVLASQQAEARLLDLQLGPRVAIVGGGIAGLNAAYRLRQRGIRAQVYEAADRVGGRMHTVRNVLAQGLTTELGGEFIDSGHKEMLDLARRFHLELIDTQGRSERGLIPEAYLFNGRRGINEVVEAFRPLAQQIQADYDGTSEIVDYAHHSPFDVELDRLSIAEYLDRIGAAGPIRELLAVAYLTEYGLEIERQSALNLVYLIGTDTTGPQGAPRFEVFGESDERYKIRGGNDLLTRRMGKALREQIHLGHWLEAVTQSGRGYRLTFSRPNSSVEEVDADFVILCIPFSILRSVRFQPELPPIKRRAIQELAYGTNSKLIVGLRSRVWREQGYGGNIFTNVGFQSGWDSSRGQKPRDGSFTFYTGGNLGVELGNGTPEAWAQRFMPGLEQAFPGVIAAQNGNVLREHWPSNPLTLGSYAAYEPGHWTTIAGAEGVPVGNLFFAGEHCSYDYQGYMNGGAVTGRQAARAVLRKMAQLSG